MSEVPLTFLFTDVEGSTKLWEQHPEAMRTALARHDVLLRQAVQAGHGTVFKTVGDAFCAVFTSAAEAVAASLAAQRALAAEVWGETPLRVRMALHTGIAIEQNGDYLGPTINRLSRLLSAGHGGQILLSQATAEQVRDSRPGLRDLGEHRLKDLNSPEHIFQLLASDLPTDFPPLRSLQAFSHNLPIQLTSFIGRENEISEVKRLLVGKDGDDSPRQLLTLSGVGGTGKTRLALQVAADLLDAYADGVWLIELASLADPNLVPQTVALVLGMRQEASRPVLDTLADYLRARHALLLLDNCEHLIEACAHLADTLLHTCPRLQIVATSREILGIPGETTYHVPSLSLPPVGRVLPPGKAQSPLSENATEYQTVIAKSEAVRLFVERAVAVQPEFALTSQNAPLIAQICSRLDGIPLAIELAAARVRSLPVEQIAPRLDNRFRLLTGGSRTALPRQQTLQALIDWSYDLLSPAERVLLRRASVFVGGWTLEAAEAVCTDSQSSPAGADRRSGFDRRTVTEPWAGIERRSGIDRRSSVEVSIVTEDILDLLTHLVDKSLVVEQESSGEARYHMLETIRQYAREKLLASGEAEPIHSNHLGFYAQLAVKADPKLWSAEQGHWLDCLETELDNIRVGLEWGEASPRVDEVEAGLQLAGSLWQFWLVRGHWSEGREPLTRLLARADFPESTSLSATSLRARALNLAGVLAGQQGDFAQARQLHAEGLAIARQLEDQVNTAYASYGLGSISFLEGDFIGAHTHLENSLILFRKCDDKRGIAVALGNLGEVALRQNNLATARACFDESLAVCRQMGHKMGAAGSLNALGALSLRQGDLATAQDFFSEALTIFRELDDKPGMAESISGLSYVALRRGDYGTVRAMSEEALMINQKLGSKRAVAATLLRLGKATRCLNDHTLAHSYYEEGLTIFRELSLSGGISISLYNLGSLALLQGNHHQAELLFRESLTLALEKEDTPNIAYSYLGLAGVLASSGKSESFYQAARLLGQAEALFEASNTAFDEADCKDHDRTVGLLLEGLGESAFNAARTEGQTMSFDQAVTVLYRLNGLWW